MVKRELAVVDTVVLVLHAHVVDGDAATWSVILVADGYQERVNALVVAFDNEVRKDDCIVGMDSALRDP